MDDDDNDLPPSASVLRTVLGFTVRHWRRRPWLTAGVAAGMAMATATEILVPFFAGRMVDAVGAGRGAAPDALWAFGGIVALGAAMVVLRHLAWWAVIPLTLGMMRDAAQDAFARVQRLSTDWHANSFSGSTQRRITRGMWAIDTINDVLLTALFPSLVVLAGTVVLLGLRWPLLGGVMGWGRSPMSR